VFNLFNAVDGLGMSILSGSASATGDEIDEPAFKDLIPAAILLNLTGKKK
jgi:hypothetical protein